jgi:hypothetical protein
MDPLPPAGGIFIGQEGAGAMDYLKAGSEGISAATGLLNLPTNIYSAIKGSGRADQELALKKRAMNQDYIAKQRQLDWQQKFRDHMIGAV